VRIKLKGSAELLYRIFDEAPTEIEHTQIVPCASVTRINPVRE
jgi:hypothetical protein